MSGQRTWAIRELVETDLPRIGELFEQVMGFRRPEGHNQWKFVDNPAGRPLGMVAGVGDRIVGQYALWPTYLRLGADVVLGAQSLDTMTHPDYQGQGMFTVLANACMDLAVQRGVLALYGFPNPNSYPGFVRKLNWDHSGDVQSWVRLIRPSAHPRIPLGCRTLADIGARVLPAGRTSGLEIRIGAPALDDLGVLLQGWGKEKNACLINRTPAWMHWRFAEASAMQYEWVTAYRGGQPIACAVWGIDMVGGRGDGKLSELLGKDEEGLVAVLSVVVRHARERGCPTLATVTSVDRFTGPLKRVGFLRGRKIPLIVRSMTPKSLGGNIHDHESWQIVGSDLDTY